MKITVTDIPEYLQPDAQGKWVQEMDTARRQIGGHYRTAVKQAIDATVPYPPKFDRHLWGGIHFDPLPGNVLGVRVTVSKVTEVYGAVMELGRKPGAPGPPLAPIKEWVRRKLGLQGKELDSAAFLIRRKIHVKGIEPRHFFKRTRDNPQLRKDAKALALAGVRAFKKRVGEHDR